MATDYKIVVVPDTRGTRPCIECPQCLGLQLLFVKVLVQYCNIHMHAYFSSLKGLCCVVNHDFVKLKDYIMCGRVHKIHTTHIQ